jgi:hypothetical protein
MGFPARNFGRDCEKWSRSECYDSAEGSVCVMHPLSVGSLPPQVGAAQAGFLPILCCHGRMTSIPSDGLAVFIGDLLIAAIAGRVLADVAREVRILLLSWLALRDTHPRQRARIIDALHAGQQRSSGTHGRAGSARGSGPVRHLSTGATETHLPSDKPDSVKSSPANRARRERRSP